jgi:hypothetical protein
MPKQLQVISGPDTGRTFQLSDEGTLLLGRSRKTQSPLTDRKVSRVHCQVEADGDQMILTDLDSQSGTSVNGKRITEHPLQPGDVIQIGETKLCYLAQPEDLANHSTLVAEGPVAIKLENLPPERMHELSGKVISHYDIGPVMGKSTTGILFQARDFKDERTIGLMVLFPEVTKTDDQKRRFIRTMKSMHAARHPALATIHNAGKTGPYCWIAMESVEDKARIDALLADLDRLVKSEPALSSGAGDAPVRADTVIEPPRKPAVPTATIMERVPRESPPAPTETVVEKPRKPDVRSETIVDRPPPAKPKVPTDTVIELHKPRLGGREKGQLNPSGPARGLTFRVWLIAGIVVALLVGAALVWFLRSRS